MKDRANFKRNGVIDQLLNMNLNSLNSIKVEKKSDINVWQCVQCCSVFYSRDYPTDGCAGKCSADSKENHLWVELPK